MDVKSFVNHLSMCVCVIKWVIMNEWVNICVSVSVCVSERAHLYLSVCVCVSKWASESDCSYGESRKQRRRMEPRVMSYPPVAMSRLTHSAPLAPERSMGPRQTNIRTVLSLVATQAAAMVRRAVCCRSLASWSRQVRLGRPLGLGSLNRTTCSGGGSARARWPKRRSRAKRIFCRKRRELRRNASSSCTPWAEWAIKQTCWDRIDQSQTLCPFTETTLMNRRKFL